MLRITLLSKTLINLSAQGSRTSVPLTPKQTALIAFLALEDRSVARNEILPLFWPDSDEQRARASLSQLIHAIHKSIGLRAVESIPNDSLRLAVDSECDALQFRRLVANEEYPAAADSWPGHLMPGFAINVASSTFQEWLDQRRTEYRNLLTEAVFRATRTTAEPERKLAWLERASNAAPFDERILRQHMELLASQGNQAAVLQAYQAFRLRLSLELDAEPSKESTRLLRELSTRSDAIEEHASSDIVSTPQTTSSVPGPKLRKHWLLTGAVSATLVTILIGIGWAMQRPLRGANDTVTIAVGTSTDLWPVSDMVRFQLRSISPDLTISREAGGADYHLTMEFPVDEGQQTALVTITSRAGVVLSSAALPFAEGASIQSIAESIVDRVISDMQTIPISDGLRTQIRMEGLLRDAKTHAQTGAFENSERDVRAVEKIALNASLPRTNLYLSRVEERRGWNDVDRGKFNAGIHHFVKADGYLRHEKPSSEIFERLGSLNYIRWVVDTQDNFAVLDTAADFLTRSVALDGTRGSAWLELSQVQLASGRFAEAMSAAQKAKRLLLTPSQNSAASVQLFMAAFNARYDTVARDECYRIRALKPHESIGVACLAMVAGWTTGPTVDTVALLLELDRVEEPAPIRAIMDPRLRTLIRAAAVRKGIPTAPVAIGTTTDWDLLAFRIAEATALRSPEAAELRQLLESTAAGRRVMRLNARLLAPNE